MQGIKYLAWFTQEGTVCTAVQIDLGDARKNGNLFDALEKRSVEITSCFGGGLKWERLDAVRYSLIAVYRDGTIESSEGELQEIRVWQVENLLKLKEVFTPEIKRALETIDNAEIITTRLRHLQDDDNSGLSHHCLHTSTHNRVPTL